MTAIDPDLEANYNIASARGGLDEVMQRWSASSAALRAQVDASLDCAYGAGERERIDIFFEDGTGFVFNAIHNIQSNVPTENIQAMFKAINDVRQL